MLLARVELALGQRPPEGAGPSAPRPGLAYDQELIALRDQIAEAKPEDVAPLVETMARVAALAAGRRREGQVPIDPQSPYFAHMRLRERPGGRGDGEGRPPGEGETRVRDILVG